MARDTLPEDHLWGTVLSAERLSPSIVRIRLGGDDFRRFQSSGVPDEFIWLVFPARPGGPQGELALPGRYYTIRVWDPVANEMSIDFVVHEQGVATSWARQAEPGDRLGLLVPRHCFEPPQDARWILLVTDVTGLPAAGRIVEECPAGRRVVAHVEIPVAEDRQALRSAGDVDVTWHESAGREAGETGLPTIARAIGALPDGPGYIFIAGETDAVRACRRHFRDGLGVEKRRLTAVAYWTKGQARG